MATCLWTPLPTAVLARRAPHSTDPRPKGKQSTRTQQLHICFVKTLGSITQPMIGTDHMHTHLEDHAHTLCCERQGAGGHQQRLHHLLVPHVCHRALQQHQPWQQQGWNITQRGITSECCISTQATAYVCSLQEHMLSRPRQPGSTDTCGCSPSQPTPPLLNPSQHPSMPWHPLPCAPS